MIHFYRSQVFRRENNENARKQRKREMLESFQDFLIYSSILEACYDCYQMWHASAVIYWSIFNLKPDA